MKKNSLIFCLIVTLIPMKSILFAANRSSEKSVQAVVLAAGHGSRLKTGISKMITPICGQPMVVYALKLMEKLGIPMTAVIGYQKESVKIAIESAEISHLNFAEQKQQLGTGHALLASKELWHADNILVINGDMPLLNDDIMQKIITQHLTSHAAITIATSYNVDPANTYGRIVNENGITKIVEKKHFTHAITDFPYVNVGIYLINRAFLEQYCTAIEQNNVTQEFYITDLVEIASKNNLHVATVTFPFDLMYGVNTFQELAHVEQIKRDELIHYWMAQGVRFIVPNTNHLDVNVKIGRGTVIGAGVQLLNGTTIGEFCTIHPYSILDGALIADKAVINPYSMMTKGLVNSFQNRKSPKPKAPILK